MMKIFFDKKIILFSLCQMLILLSFFILSNTFELLYLAVLGTILNYIISFYVVNIGKINLFNASTYFLLGIALLLLGKYIAFFMDSQTYTQQEISCFDFFVYYCMDYYEHFKILFFLNITMIAFSLGHSINRKNDDSIQKVYYKLKSVKIITFAMYFVLFYVAYSSIKNIIIAIQKGYMFLYEAAAGEAYQTPMLLIFQSVLLAYIAFLYVHKQENVTLNKHYKLFLTIYLVILYLGILTGGRGGFVSAILITVWLFLDKKKISLKKYIYFFILGILVVSFTDVIGGLTGARPMADADRGVLDGIKNTFFSQGATLFVLDSALKMEEVSFLGYLKTIIPGIQIVYTKVFGITERYLFDWGSYLAYSNNPDLYYRGFGLGWSVFADFYLLSFKFFPLYFLLVIFFGFMLNKLYFSKKNIYKGVLFILMFNIFILPRSSISPVIFNLFIYWLFSFFLLKKITNESTPSYQ